jgi:hypothetical protein
MKYLGFKTQLNDMFVCLVSRLVTFVPAPDTTAEDHEALRSPTT